MHLLLFLEILKIRIIDTLKIYEPRVTVENVTFNDPDSQRLDNNTLNCLISFRINNAPQRLEEVEVMVQRLR